MGICLRQSGVTITAIIDSNELSNSSTPLLLSKNSQGRLGLVKNMRTGKCTLLDYPGEELTLGRSKDTDLLVMNISQFD